MDVDKLNVEQAMAVTDTSYLPTNIRALRKRQGLSQDELAQRIGLNRGNIASYEKASAEPKICNLLKMSALFEVSVWDLSSKDLSDTARMERAIEKFRRLDPGLNVDLTQFQQQAQEIAVYIQGIENCCCYKRRSFDELSEDAQVLQGFYQQLHEATQKLLQQHQALLGFVGCTTE